MREVNRFAGVLKNLGVNKGDRVTIYLPMIPEAAVAMLACTRIGAPHSVVFRRLLGRFAAGAHQRLAEQGPHHRRRRLAARQRRPAQGHRRRGPFRRRLARASRASSSTTGPEATCRCRPGATAGGTS
jgi:hypothetical protein